MADSDSIKLCECGCGKAVRNKFRPGHNSRTHGLSLTPTYGTWMSMRRRCTDPRMTNYERYGAQGVKVCDRWLNSFENFLADMGERPPGTTIDRIDRFGHYEPGNCRWATPKVQANNHGGLRLVTAFGRTKTISQWAEERGMSHACLSQRLNRLPAEQALTRPVALKDLSITAFGITKTMKSWARDTGIKYATLYYRVVLNNWPAEKALTKRVQSQRM